MSNAASTLGFNRTAIVSKDGISSRDLRKWFEKIEQKTFNLLTTGFFPTSFLTGAGVVSAAGPLIASGSIALATSPIGGGASQNNTVAATGILTTDVIQWTAARSPTSGYAPSASGSLYIFVYPTTNLLNFLVCNPTGGSITPGAMTLNYRVVR